jgi:hypothetical protein
MDKLLVIFTLTLNPMTAASSTTKLKRGAVYAQTNRKHAHSSHLRLQNALKSKTYHPSNNEEELAFSGRKFWALSGSTNRELQLLHIFHHRQQLGKCSSSPNYSP